ncbi:MAG: 2-hydroxyacid dehydrogenase [Clostridium sp.]
MKCVAVGDMFLSEEAFARVLKHHALFCSYQGFSWKADLDRVSTRTLIRKIETKGSEAYAVEGELKEAMLDADVIFVHMCPVGKDIIEQAPHLKYIVTARGGVENIAVESAKKKGIRVIHCPMHNAFAVAELTVGLMICETRNVTRADRSLREGIWRESYPNTGSIRELRSMTVGLIGFGAIGQLVAQRLQPFGCSIMVHDPYLDASVIERHGCIAVDKKTLLQESDIVSLHGRIGPKDPPIIGRYELALMKPHSYLINTARAVLVDMPALEEALQSGRIMGAAIDVFPKEPLTKEDRIVQLDNCTLTNHRGGDTLDSYERSPELLLEQLKEAVETGKTSYMIMPYDEEAGGK